MNALFELVERYIYMPKMNAVFIYEHDAVFIYLNMTFGVYMTCSVYKYIYSDNKLLI